VKKKFHKKEKADGLSRFEIILYFSQKKQETGGTTLDLSLLVKKTKQLQGEMKASKLVCHFRSSGKILLTSATVLATLKPQWLSVQGQKLKER